jgi:hypothetical protein
LSINVNTKEDIVLVFDTFHLLTSDVLGGLWIILFAWLAETSSSLNHGVMRIRGTALLLHWVLVLRRCIHKGASVLVHYDLEDVLATMAMLLLC